jgi:flagellin
MEGAMATIDDSLIRMKELAEQAATGSYSDQQRNIMNNEFAQMAAEITRVASTTEFNTIRMLDSAGSGAAQSIHFGIDSSGSASSITVSSVDVTAATLGVDSGTQNITTTSDAGSALTAVNLAIKAKDSARAMFGYMMNRIQSTNTVLNISAENLKAAESRVSDVDVASEMAAMTRNQVLAQAGVAMLGQANSMPQMALSLLR